MNRVQNNTCSNELPSIGSSTMAIAILYMRLMEVAVRHFHFFLYLIIYVFGSGPFVECDINT